MRKERLKLEKQEHGGGIKLKKLEMELAYRESLKSKDCK